MVLRSARFAEAKQLIVLTAWEIITSFAISKKGCFQAAYYMFIADSSAQMIDSLLM